MERAGAGEHRPQERATGLGVVQEIARISRLPREGSRPEGSPAEALPGRELVEVGIERLPAVEERARSRRGQELVDRGHARDHGRGQGRVGEPDALAVQDRVQGGDAAPVGRGHQHEVAYPSRAGPGDGRVLVRLRRPEAQVVAGHQAAHAVADQVEAGLRIAPGLGQRFQMVVQGPGRLHEVAPPVIGEDVVVGSARSQPPGAEARILEEVDHVRVLGEAEDAGEDGVGAEERSRHELVPGGRDGQGERQLQVVVAEGVAQVEPGLGPVGTEELAAQDAGDQDHAGQVGVVRGRLDEPRVQPPPRGEGRGQDGPRRPRHDAGEKRPEA